jgi:hypothetical protein
MCFNHDVFELSERGRTGGVLTDDEQRRLDYYLAESRQKASDNALATSKSSE